MSVKLTQLTLRQWLQGAAAVAVLLSATQAVMPSPAMANPGTLAERSQAAVEPLLALDAEVADALQQRSAERLERAYEALKSKADASSEDSAAGEQATGCDVAVLNLVIAVGFALNKLDGKERFEPWMLQESLSLLDDYHISAKDCAEDAGRVGFASKILPELFETL